MIENYSFGKITINRKKYNSDLIIYENSVDDTWWRKEGHNLRIEDIHIILDKNPEVLIIGTGAYGLMKVSSDLIEYLKSKNIRVIIKKTKDACDEYNHLSQNKKVIAALHLTC
ncbi:MAG: MTH938/NDUFAF3 family protein, partial [Candidatus Caldatribacteriota bacterium]|nr:MTH938/NDUFAF3 family protein [Candidatus Caldatribacteriota bacterium]